jgi:hypothetical protein
MGSEKPEKTLDEWIDVLATAWPEQDRWLERADLPDVAREAAARAFEEVAAELSACSSAMRVSSAPHLSSEDLFDLWAKALCNRAAELRKTSDE